MVDHGRNVGLPLRSRQEIYSGHFFAKRTHVELVFDAPEVLLYLRSQPNRLRVHLAAFLDTTAG